MFVDYAGTTLTVHASTGEVMTAQLFVAVLGASNYTYADATWTQGLSDWIGAHTRTFAFFETQPDAREGQAGRRRPVLLPVGERAARAADQRESWLARSRTRLWSHIRKVDESVRLIEAITVVAIVECCCECRDNSCGESHNCCDQVRVLHLRRSFARWDRPPARTLAYAGTA
jgi:hypothetical protein